jgi:hypothetical protein
MRDKADSCRTERHIDLDGTDIEGSKINLKAAGLKTIFH